MSNYLFITDRYLPNPSSNGACVNNLVKCVEASGDFACVLTVNCSEGENVYSINKETRKIKRRDYFFGYCQDRAITEELYSYAVKLHGKYRFDYVVSFFRPVETVLCGMKLYKNFKMPHMPIFFDIIESNRSFKKKILALGYKRLLKKLAKFGKVGTLKYYKDYFTKIGLPLKNFEFLGIPNVISKTANRNETKERDEIIMFYAGSFSEECRNPTLMLEFLKFIIGTNVKIYIYSSFGCWDILEKYKKEYGDNLIINTQISYEEFLEKLYGADVLLNLSNNMKYQVPGKFFEFVATGKPILNFRFRSDDPGNSDYVKYPLIFNVDDYADNSQEKCKNFIMQNVGKTIDIKEIERLFADCTPKYYLSKINLNKSGITAI